MSPIHLSPLVATLEKAVERAQGNDISTLQAVCSVPPRHAKALDVDTPMLTRRGWVRAGDVVVGDSFVGSSGEWTTVEGVYPQGEVRLYDVTFSDHTSLRVSGDHIWTVRGRYGSGRDRSCDRWENKTTLELLDRGLRESDGRSRWRVPMMSPWVGNESALPLDPYLLGIWLGNGTSKAASVTSLDVEPIDAFRAAGFQTSYVYSAGKAKTYGFLGLYSVLREMGLIGNKHVPDSYLRASAGDRLALLQGLCDSDGTASKDGSIQSFTTTTKALAESFRFLVVSLGGKFVDFEFVAAEKDAHRISFQLPGSLSAFRLERKRRRLNERSKRNEPKRLLRDISDSGRGEAVCFSVDAPDKLFAAGRDLVLTHNTETILAGIAWGLMLRPELTFGFVTYNDHLAASKSRKAQAMAVAAGVDLVTTNVAEWRTSAGGGLLASGIMGTWTGHGVDIAIVDDGFKNRLEAESSTYRNRVWDQFSDAICTRIEPGGTVIVNGTRWHPDDLIGRLKKDEGDRWEQITLPAIDDSGLPLWPERWPIELLEERRERVGPYTWASLFQGEPRPRGGALFGEPHTYHELPTNGIMKAIGVDLAYAAKTSADWSVMAICVLHDGKVYIVDIVRRQEKAPEFKHRVYNAWIDNGRPVCRWYAYGPEKGIGDFLSEAPDPVPVEIIQAHGDHFVRSQPMAAAWNRGDVLVPDRAPWLDDFLAEVCSFTGVNDDHDDQIDAVCASFDVLAPYLDRRTPLVIAPGSEEWARIEAKKLREWAMRDYSRRNDERSERVRDLGFDPGDPTSIF